MVALFNLYVFKCLQDVHVNFMNPSVFVTQPSAKEKINFPRETETHRERERLTNFLSVFSWLNHSRGSRMCTPIVDCLSLKGTNLSNQSVQPLFMMLFYLLLVLLFWGRPRGRAL